MIFLFHKLVVEIVIHMIKNIYKIMKLLNIIDHHRKKKQNELSTILNKVKINRKNFKNKKLIK